MEQEFCLTRIDLFEDSTESIWNNYIKFDTGKKQWKLSVLEGK